MTRNVRNFWVDVGGTKKPPGMGPHAKDGGLDLDIKVREAGCVVDSIDVLCRANGNTLTVTVQHNGAVVYEHTTERD